MNEKAERKLPPPPPPFLDPALEPVIRAVFEDAYRGAMPTIEKAVDLKAALKDREFWLRFYRAAHAGFARAQDVVADRILKLEEAALTAESTKREALVLRSLMDGIAWQMIGGQLYVARRLFRGGRPPSLKQSNFESVRDAAREAFDEETASFGLISDLTSFVQLGDLLIMEPLKGGLSFVEVKAGTKNRKILEFIRTLPDAPCTYRALFEFAAGEGPKMMDQLGRVIRQAKRLSDAHELLAKGEGFDEELGMTVVIPEQPVKIEDYNERLSATICKSQEHGWAIDVIDDCLFVGAYREIMQTAGSFVFTGWFEACGAPKGSPVHNLLSCISSPLAMPLFLRLPIDQVCDLLFGRCTVAVGLHLDEFIKLAKKQGMSVRWSSRKEAAKPPYRQAYKVDNRALVFSRGESELILSDGLLMRMMCHGTTPLSALDLIEKQFALADELNSKAEGKDGGIDAGPAAGD